MSNKLHSTFLVLSVGFLLTACGKKEQPTQEQPIDESAVAVKLTPVQVGEYSLPIASSGLIATENESRLSFKIAGIVSKIYVKEGQSVTKGQLLASLDLTEINAQVGQAKNNLDKTKRDLERGQRLLKDSAATIEQLQNLQTAFQVADEAYRIATFNQQYATIRANQSGKVIRKLINEGELVSPGAPALIINAASQNNWLVKIGLPDVDWVRVKIGDHVKVTTDAYPNTAFEGVVSTINEGADAISGLYQAEVKVNPGNKKLASGLFAKVQIIPTDKTKLWIVPIEALVEGAGKQAYVFVANADQKTLRKVSVQIAYLEGTQAYLWSGVEEVSEVITAGSAFLTENSTITISK
ncbi:MAG: efflux RND transporter periplasmic adaptor subunit [Cyclobacteriaceae bacterium]|nr:efflux RND transporter periplasmic adaptor subunit [Cyclobacteriaceae bacterium]